MVLASVLYRFRRALTKSFCAKLHHATINRAFLIADTETSMPNNHYDIVIIGTGAGGPERSPPSWRHRKEILLLERGDYVPREKDNWSRWS